MPRAFGRSFLLSLVCSTVSTGVFAADFSSKTESPRAREPGITVVISGGSTAYMRFAEDIQAVLEEGAHPSGLRVFPLLGRGGPQNLADIMQPRGADVAIVDAGDLRAAKEANPTAFASADKTIQYIAKLATIEFSLLGRSAAPSLASLRGRKVNCVRKSSPTDKICQALFKALNLDVEFTYFDQDRALERLRSGEIAAIARIGSFPYANDLKASDDYRFIPIRAADFTDAKLTKLFDLYPPSLLTESQFPGLVAKGAPVPTISASMLLVTYAWPAGSERSVRISRFVGAFFDRVEELRSASYHPKWQDINLAANVFGWIRLKAAQDWIDARKSRDQTIAHDLRTALAAYFAARPGAAPLTDEERDRLFSRFVDWANNKSPVH